MRPPFSFYGGKNRLIPTILPLIPNHVQYVEPFCGSAAVFWNKIPSENEVLNDIDSRLTNFYYQLKTNYPELKKLVDATLHNENSYRDAIATLKDPNADPLKRAWACWASIVLSFSSIMCGSFAFGANRKSGRTTTNNKNNFTELLAKRLENCEIFNRDALDIIKLKDSNSENNNSSTFFFIDSPYHNSDMGHYGGYTEQDFINLLETLKNIKGKFLMTSYPSDILTKYRNECGWRSRDIQQVVSVTGKREGGQKKKIECLTMNYDAPSKQQTLFDDNLETEIEEDIVLEDKDIA